MNYKNILQEYCQKNKFTLPIYRSWSKNISHIPDWYANVAVNEEIVEIDYPQKSKTSAQQHAAKWMLDYLNKKIPQKSEIFDPTEINQIYLIDLENKPCFKCDTKRDSLYIGFINSIHHSLGKYDMWHKCDSDDIFGEISVSKNNKLIYLIDGGTIDLVDHFITAFIYPVLNFIRLFGCKQTVNIVSSDHSGWCTRECLTKIFKWHQLSDIKINNIIKI